MVVDNWNALRCVFDKEKRGDRHVMTYYWSDIG